MTRSIPAVIIATFAFSACAERPPAIAYDDQVPPMAPPPATTIEEVPHPPHTPPAWTPSRGGAEAGSPEAQVTAANAAARIEPRQEGYYNALQVFPWSEGALYQVYAAPGKITTLALEPGERLSGPGPIAAGDTARWIIGDTTSGSGRAARINILIKPTRPDIATNLVISTDRRTYILELRASDETWMPAVAWAYPQEPRETSFRALFRGPEIPPEAERNYRYRLIGDAPPWRPVAIFDDGRRVYVVFPPGIAQGEMPPLLVIGENGEGQIVNTRIRSNVLIVDRLFAAAELRLGAKRQDVVRIERDDSRAGTASPEHDAPK